MPTPPRAPTTATTLPSFRLDRARRVRAWAPRDSALASSCAVSGLTMYSLTPASHQVAIEADIVAVADRDHRDAGLADFGKVMHLRGRHIGAADVDDDAFRASARRRGIGSPWRSRRA